MALVWRGAQEAKERVAVAPIPIRRSLVIGEGNGESRGQNRARQAQERAWGGYFERAVSPKKRRVFGMRGNLECCGIWRLEILRHSLGRLWGEFMEGVGWGSAGPLGVFVETFFEEALDGISCQVFESVVNSELMGKCGPGFGGVELPD